MQFMLSSLESLQSTSYRLLIEHFSLAVMAEALQVNIRRNRPLLKGVGYFEAKH